MDREKSIIQNKYVFSMNGYIATDYICFHGDIFIISVLIDD